MHNAQITNFGHTADGQPVERITFSSGNLRAEVLTYGAILHRLWHEGVTHPLSEGGAGMADYLGDYRYSGALIAPVANRLSRAEAPIGGQIHKVEANENGITSLHSGTSGAHCKVWTITDADETSVTLALDLAHGEGGFPGVRRITARYSLSAPATLRLDITATTDRRTLMNIANHSYWNLDGSPSWEGHSLTIAAEHFLPTGPDSCPTGEVRAVAGTGHDFRSPRHPQPGQPPLDHAFILSRDIQPLREVVQMTGRSGLRLNLSTTERSVQIYDARKAPLPGGRAYQSLAIEAQGWPDSPNNAGFPSIEITPEAPYRQTTEWRFDRV
jgi:aldose 1-epimerase